MPPAEPPVPTEQPPSLPDGTERHRDRPPPAPARPPRPDLFEEPPAFHPHWLPPPPHPPRPARSPRARPAAARAGRWGAAALVVAFVAVAFVGDARETHADHDVLITDDHSGDSYVRADGQPNAITDLCGSSRQPENEPSVAVDPRDPRVVAVGSNDSCGSRFGSHWAGYYRSADGGRTWTRSLVPGFVQDTSVAGIRSPVHHRCDLAGDPALSFDDDGTLFYGFVCVGQFNPRPGAIYVARYEDDGARYAGTVLVPSSNANGFEDKPTLAVDTTGRGHDGAVYTAWTDFTTFRGRIELCQGVLFARSTDGGHTFQRSKLISGPVCAEFADIAVGPFGAVYVTFRSDLKVWITYSADGGVTFTRPIRIANVKPFSGNHFAVTARNCGDGPDHCVNGLTFPRSETFPSVAVDGNGVHVVWTELDPVGRGRVYVKTSPDGYRWDTPAVEVHPETRGHQWMADIATDGEHLDVVFLDSRRDRAFAPKLPPGETRHGTNSGDVVDAYLDRSTDGGRTWTDQRLSTHGSNPNWEIADDARVPFYGDYLSLSLANGEGFAAWPDSRDIVPGTDAREDGEDDDGDRGFDGYVPCQWDPDDIDAANYSLAFDECLTAGGLDQNVYGAPFAP